MAVYMGGGPSLIYGAEALSAFDALGAAAETDIDDGQQWYLTAVGGAYPEVFQAGQAATLFLRVLRGAVRVPPSLQGLHVSERRHVHTDGDRRNV